MTIILIVSNILANQFFAFVTAFFFCIIRLHRCLLLFISIQMWSDKVVLPPASDYLQVGTNADEMKAKG